MERSPEILRVATYTRISTDEEHQPYSLEAQTERLGAYVKIQDGWELVRRFSDQMSGSTLERPGLQQALTEARMHRYDLLLVYRVDRLGRSVRGLAQILDELDHAGVTFRSATEPFDTGSPAGRMMIQMLGVFAEFERATLIDRVVAGMERKAARGGWCGGTIPFGYRVNRETGFLELEQSEAPVIPLIFDLYVNKRLGAKSIAVWLNERGHRTRAGRPWTFLSVFTVLRNKSYLGQIFFRGTHYPAPHVALVEPDVFSAAHNLLTLRGQDHSKRRTNPTDYLLGGLITCGRCGKRYSGTAAHGKRSRYRYYTCLSRQRSGAHGCDAERLPAEALDDAVLQALVETYSDSELIEEAVREARDRSEADRPQHAQQLEVVEGEIRKTEEATERYFLAFEAGSMPEAQCAPRLQALSEKMVELRCHKADLQQAMDREQLSQPTDDDLASIRAKVKEAIEAGSAQERKGLLQALVAEVRVQSRSEIYPVFRLPRGGVREVYGLVDPRGFEPLTS